MTTSGTGFADFYGGGMTAGSSGTGGTGATGGGGFRQGGGYQSYQGTCASPTFDVPGMGTNDTRGGTFGRYNGVAQGHTQPVQYDPAPFEGWLDMMLLDDGGGGGGGGGDDGEGGKGGRGYENPNAQGML